MIVSIPFFEQICYVYNSLGGAQALLCVHSSFLSLGSIRFVTSSLKLFTAQSIIKNKETTFTQNCKVLYLSQNENCCVLLYIYMCVGVFTFLHSPVLSLLFSA